MTKSVDTCPKCGSHLVLKDGQFGEFWGCPRFPECRYTRPLRDVEENYHPPSPYCEKCNHTGLIPHPTIKHAWLDCECRLSIPESFQPIKLRPADYDYACSDTFRAHSYQYCNQPDPGETVPEPEVTPPQEIFHYHVDLSKQILRNLEGQVNYLQGKVMEREKKRQDFY